jgi:hypothetical protein
LLGADDIDQHGPIMGEGIGQSHLETLRLFNPNGADPIIFM